MEISCVSTLYRSEAFVSEFVDRCEKALSGLTDSYEIILVDDGSPDASLQIAKGLIASHPNLRVIELSRNFGHHAAILAGLEASRGALVFFVDSDLEEDPALIGQFHADMGPEVDVVFGYHERTGEPALRKLTSGVFWRLMSAISDTKISVDMANVRLMRRVYVDALLAMPDRNLFLGGMFPWPGFRQRGVQIERKRREQSSYSWLSRIRLATVAAISFSKRPLFLVFALGLSIAALAFLVGIAVVINRLVNGAAVLDGWTSLMLSVWFLGGLLLVGVGILGFYIAQIFDQSRARPRYFVRAEYKATGLD